MPVISCEKERVARKFSNAAETYNDVANVQFQAGVELLQRVRPYYVTSVAAAKRKILDIGCGTGRLVPELLSSLCADEVVGVDISQQMLNKAKQAVRDKRASFCCADFEDLPPHQVYGANLLYSNFAMQWSLSPDELFYQLYNAAAKNTILAFTVPGTKTFKEMALAWYQVDNSRHVNQFDTLQQWSMRLYRAGFKILFQQRSVKTDYFGTVKELLLDVRRSGVTHSLTDRRKTLLGKALYQQFLEAYAQQAVLVGDKVQIPLTYEIYTIIARRS